MAMLRKAALTAHVPLLMLLVVASVPPLAYGQTSGQPVTFKVSGASSRMEMIVNTSRILTMDYKVPRMLVQNPEILTATPISPTQVQISAQSPGVTHLNLWDEQGQVYTVDILISPDGRELEQLLALEFPDASLRVRPLSNSVVISGYVPSAQMVSRVVRMAEDYYPSVINNIEVGGVQTVLLHTKVIEVSRTKLRQVGVDWSLQTHSFNGISSVTGLLTAAGGTLATSGTETFAYTVVDGAHSLASAIQFMQQKNLAKILAEPTLTTVSGRPASFQSGGEFPIPVPQQNGVTSIEFREFGTRVDYVPIVLGNGTIRLEVRPSVTEVDASRSVSIGGTTVPGLRSRWVDTAVEMKAGQTLAIAGLIQTRTEATQRGIPHLADMPVIGIPFRRLQHETNEVEMLVLVTPEFVDGLDAHEAPTCLPGLNTTNPNDCELCVKSYLEVPNCRCMGAGCPNCRQMHAVPHEHHVVPAEEVTPAVQHPPIVKPPVAPSHEANPTAQQYPLGRKPTNRRTAAAKPRSTTSVSLRDNDYPSYTAAKLARRQSGGNASPNVRPASSNADVPAKSLRSNLPPIVNPITPHKRYSPARKPVHAAPQIRMPTRTAQPRQQRTQAHEPPVPEMIGPVGSGKVQ